MHDHERRKICASFLAVGAFWFGTAATKAAQTRLTFADLYIRQGEFPASLVALAGQTVAMRGFMAPPLKAEAKFFVLTKLPMATCPFCGSEIDWPDDIVVVNTRSLIQAVDFNVPIEAEGVLELGTATDGDTGFVSRVRFADARYRRL